MDPVSKIPAMVFLFVFQHAGILIAADPSGNSLFLYNIHQDFPDQFQGKIPFIVAVAVVDDLQIVHINVGKQGPVSLCFQL